MWGLQTRAFPAGQGRLRLHYIARRKLVFIFEESPYSASIILHALDIFKAKLHNFTFRVVYKMYNKIILKSTIF
ncbi:hypothetical protein D8M06_03940 [Oceanobacillus halophilus]|uniref:Uncharacterized protein n=1 Tax=Oceanobacillus halophilus TaxID=930130 RepID=A0A495ADA4_9BACI|nr:hypothetical protein D8M06_03940 [Oceanobacillus halophilus]